MTVVFTWPSPCWDLTVAPESAPDHAALKPRAPQRSRTRARPPPRTARPHRPPGSRRWLGCRRPGSRPAERARQASRAKASRRAARSSRCCRVVARWRMSRSAGQATGSAWSGGEQGRLVVAAFAEPLRVDGHRHQDRRTGHYRQVAEAGCGAIRQWAGDACRAAVLETGQRLAQRPVGEGRYRELQRVSDTTRIWSQEPVGRSRRRPEARHARQRGAVPTAAGAGRAARGQEPHAVMVRKAPYGPISRRLLLLQHQLIADDRAAAAAPRAAPGNRGRLDRQAPSATAPCPARPE